MKGSFAIFGGWTGALLLSVVASPIFADGPAPIHHVFDLSDVVADAARSQIVEARLWARMVPELRGPATSTIKMRTAVAMENGVLACRVYVTFAGQKESLIHRQEIRSLDDLPEVVNAQALSSKAWAGEMVLQLEGKKWNVRALNPRADTPLLMTALGRPDEVWKADDSCHGLPAREVAVTSLTDAKPVKGDILVLRGMPEKSTVVLTVRNSLGVPLSDITVYARAKGFHDLRSTQLKDETPVCRTDDKGEARFGWKGSDGVAYLLVARNGIALTRDAMAPSQETQSKNLTIASRWLYKGKVTTLDDYVVAMRIEIDQIEKAHAEKMKKLKEIHELIAKGDLDSAMLRLQSDFAPNDPTAATLLESIKGLRKDASVAVKMYDAQLAMAVKDYDKAITILEDALSTGGAAGKEAISQELDKARKARQDLEAKTAGAKTLLFTEMAKWATAAEIGNKLPDIEAAVKCLCDAGQLRTLERAVAELGKAEGTVGKALGDMLDEIKADKRDVDDPAIEKTRKTQERLNELAKQILDAMNASAGAKP